MSGDSQDCRNAAPGPGGLPMPSLAEATLVWLRIALLSFGGPAGQIAVMHRILVEEKRWIPESRFLYALNYCTLLPGPEATELATYIGWLMHRTVGGVIAGVLFVLPGIVSILALSLIYAVYGQTDIVSGLFFGLKAAVLAIVVEAVMRIGRRALRNGATLALAAFAFVAIFFFSAPFPLIVLGAVILGYAATKGGATQFAGGGHGGDAAEHDGPTVLGDDLPAHAKADAGQSLRVAAICLILWLGPVAALLATLGPTNVFSTIAVFFSKMAVVTFGGAYAVLAYVAQQAVETHGWLSAGEMLDGLGMAETTPGPLIMVLQFVDFLGAMRAPGPLNPLVAGTLGGLLATWVTFAPCFLWIFLGAPFLERLRSNRALAGALAAVTAAVVGVVLNLALWFAIQTLFRARFAVKGWGLDFDAPVLSSVEGLALTLAAGAALAMFRFKVGAVPVLAACGAAGIGLRFAGLV